MTFRPSSSEGGPTPSDAFKLLHDGVRRWIWDQGWSELRDIQELSIPVLLEGRTDVIVSAATAGGKTEAAFLPICSRLVAEPAPGIRALYVGPLKALINDQFERLDGLCEQLGLPVHRWHGDVPQSRKQRVLRDPSGILLTTPESLEALFVRRGHFMPKLFAGLSYTVVDELHAFLGTERGRQVQSLLHRIELSVRRRVPRIALSATLGDMLVAAEFLRPGEGPSVRQVVSEADGQELRLQVRGYRASATEKGSRPAIPREGILGESETADEIRMADDVFASTRGSTNLVFANSRAGVEVLADRLRRLSDARYVPNEFFPHHGNLARCLRQEVEERLKDKERPSTAVCTNTLELGIDLGRVTSVGQVGTPHSVASLRQRLGRSGRRGGPAILRVFITERELSPRSTPQDALRAQLFQAIAIIQLLLQRWCEPPSSGGIHLSTLVQQVLSTIAQHGGASAAQLWHALCDSGPFADIDQRTFGRLLSCLGRRELLMQSPDGTLLLGPPGERLVNHYDFYAAFSSTEEFRLFSGGRELGTLPIDHPVAEGIYLIFAGRRWRIVGVDTERRTIDLEPSSGGVPPLFSSSGGTIHDRVRQEMLRLYGNSEVPPYLDSNARTLLDEGRQHFGRLGLAEHRLIPHERGTLLFLWRGDRALNTVLVQLMLRGLKVSRDGIALQIAGVEPNDVSRHLRDLAESGSPDPAALANAVAVKRAEKYDWVLDDELLNRAYAAHSLDALGAQEAMLECIRTSR